MKRIHLFEFEDQSWFPRQFRSLITDLLQYQLTTSRTYVPIVSKLQETIKTTNCFQLIDLCSGSSGPILQLQEILQTTQNCNISVILTDKYPNVQIFEKNCRAYQNQNISFAAQSIDATSVPSSYQGFRVLFTAFHHFRPKEAKQILQDAVDKNAPLGIFEFTERTVLNLIKVFFFAPLIVFIQTIWLRPLSWSRLFWTYVIPLAPVVYSWDALISHLRTYSVDELKSLISEVQSTNYQWEVGQIQSGDTNFRITYLIGSPVNLTSSSNDF